MRIVRRAPAAAGAPWPDSVHPVLQRIYAARGLGPGEIGTRLSLLLPPDGMPGLEPAAARLCDAIARDARILVVGDFDADGATGTAVAVRGLRLLGASRVDFRVPHRLRHGYGLSPALVADILAEGQRPDLLLTVDSGVACHAGIAAARASGIAVVVSDHHLPGATLPEADALVNPCLAGSEFGSRALAGVGVVFYLLLAVRRALRAAGRFGDGDGPDLSTLLDLVALGTVADMVPLDRNNRVLVAAGLRRIHAGRCQPGVAALAGVAGRDLSRLAARDLGFSLAPRLNAAGRLDDMRLGIACLLADDPAEAARLAGILDAINAERRELQRDMEEQAERLLPGLLDGASGSLPAGLCVHGADWHPGVVGLLASRLKDRLNRPVVALAPGSEDGLLRGSARSVAGLHVRDALADVASRHPGLLPRFGGHAGLCCTTGSVSKEAKDGGGLKYGRRGCWGSTTPYRGVSH